jgi:hypothetical protein
VQLHYFFVVALLQRVSNCSTTFKRLRCKSRRSAQVLLYPPATSSEDFAAAPGTTHTVRSRDLHAARGPTSQSIDNALQYDLSLSCAGFLDSPLGHLIAEITSTRSSLKLHQLPTRQPSRRMEQPRPVTSQKLPAGLAGVLNGPGESRDSAYFSSVDFASKR